jgi:iron complex outermembrane receptor protein
MKTIIAGSFFLIGINFFAQHIIKGKVTNEAGEPLTGVNVYVPELNKGTTTNIKGEYALYNLPKGKIKIQFSYVGYNTELKEVDVNQANVVLDVKLKEAILNTREVVITAGYIGSQHDIPVKIDVINEREIKFSSTTNEVEVLTKVPGVDILSNGPGNSKPVIHGFSRNDVLTLNNGVRMENYQLGEHHPMGIDFNDVDQVEIIQGPMTLIYGSDAIGVVINVIKNKPAPVGEIKGEYFSQFHSNTIGWNNGLNLLGSSKKLFGNIGVSHKTHADYLQGRGEFVPNSRFKELSIEAGEGFTSKWGISKVYFDHHDQTVGLVKEETIEAIQSRNRKLEKWYLQFIHDLLSVQNSFYVGKIKIDANAAFQQTLHNGYDTMPEPVNELRLRTYTYESKFRYEANRLSEFILGFQGMYQENQNLNNRPSKFLPDAHVHSLGLFTLGNYVLPFNLKLTAGFRLDGYNTNILPQGEVGDSSYVPSLKRTFYDVSGAVGASYAFRENMFLKLNFAKGYRAPNIAELTSKGIHENRFEVGDSSLRAMRSYQIDASLHYHAKYLVINVGGFYNFIRDYIFIAPTGIFTSYGLPIYRYSQADANLLGGEMSIHFHPTMAPWLHLQTTYGGVLGKQTDGTYLPLIPAQKIRYEVRFEGKKWKFMHYPSLELSGLTALDHRYPWPLEEPSPGYTIFNASFSTSFSIKKQEVILGVVVNNVFDRKYVDHLFMLKEVGYFNPGRNLSATLQLPFKISKQKER